MPCEFGLKLVNVFEETLTGGMPVDPEDQAAGSP
jgi:hypothetical protein